MSDFVTVYVNGLPMCRQPAWDVDTIRAAHAARVSLSCSHTPEDGQRLVDFLKGRGLNAYIRSGDDSQSLCEPMPTWDEDGYEEYPEIDSDARWWGE
jgi:hypothetical protein